MRGVVCCLAVAGCATWTLVRVTRLDTGASTVVRINDRGPHVEGRVIDLSNGAANDLDMVKAGVARVRLDIIHLP